MNADFDPALVRENFPAELRGLPQWLVWRLEQVPGKDKPTKIPYSRRGSKASSTNAKTWCSFDEALTAQAAGRYDGVGFVFADGVYTGIDLDHCRDAATGAIDPWAKAILDKVSSYSEASPSGTGVHLIVRATLPGPGRNKRRLNIPGAHPEAAIEMYDRGRYFTATGDRLIEYPPEIENRQDAVTALYARIESAPPKEKKSAKPSSRPPDISDTQIVEKAMAAKNGDAFRRLWGGDTSGHGGDDSAADLALCDYLAFWCGPDVARIDRLVRQSGLYREKWDREDYRDRTIAKALEGRTEFYGVPRATAPSSTPAGESEDRDVVDDESDADAAPSSIPTPRRDVDLKFQPQTDAGAAERIAALFGEHVRHVEGFGYFLWVGKRWQRDRHGVLTQCVIVAARETYRQAADLAEDRKKPLSDYARKCEQEPRIRGILKILATMPEIALDVAALDADPDLLNVDNGIVHLPTKTLRPHDPKAYCTKLAPVAYRPDAPAPTWIEFQKQVACNDAELVAFKQRAYGYSSTGQTREQCVFIGHGKGSNGKTTESNAVRFVLGDYVKNADFATFTSGKRHGGPRSDVVRLVGARLVTALEGDEGQHLDEAFLKGITGNDPQTARDMYESEIEFVPVLKPWLFSNFTPRIKGTDEGIWRRIRLIPYLAHFPKDKQDKKLPEKLRAEAEGILAWIVEGAFQWYAKGLPDVSSVDAATKDFRESQDALGQFIEERCVQRTDADVGSAALYKAYRAWSESAGEEAVRDREFKALLIDLGYVWKKENDGAKWFGLELKGLFQNQSVTA
jgi:putative DNA primase/helicase